MILYHGTNDVIGHINLEKCKLRTDFGKGFYLSDKIGTAQQWAIDKTANRGKGFPTIIQYSIDRDALNQLNGLRFKSEPTIGWLNFIGSNRVIRKVSLENIEPRHKFDWVSGPIADDKMNEVVEEYLEGYINIDDAIRRAKVLEKTFQLSLHTENAIKCVNEFEVYYRQFKGTRWLPVNPKWSKRK